MVDYMLEHNHELDGSEAGKAAREKRFQITIHPKKGTRIIAPPSEAGELIKLLEKCHIEHLHMPGKAEISGHRMDFIKINDSDVYSPFRQLLIKQIELHLT